MTKINVIKICAIGSSLRLMWFKIDDEVFAVRISDHLYCVLKSKNVPTSQSLRTKK